jgi:hypothetical protein
VWELSESGILQSGLLADADACYQNVYTIGLVLLRHMPLSAAFPRFVGFIQGIGHGYRRQIVERDGRRSIKTPMLTRLAGCLVGDWATGRCVDGIVAVEACTPLRQWLEQPRNKDHRNKEMSYWYSPLGALFTQMPCDDDLDIVWDFLIIYGAHFAVYIEAAFFVRNIRQMGDIVGLKLGIGAADQPHPQGAQELLKLAVQIFRETVARDRQQQGGRRIAEEVRTLVYGP